MDTSEASLKKQRQNEIIATNFLKKPIGTTPVGTVISGIVEVFSVGSFILTGPYALFAMAIIVAGIAVAYAKYGDEIREKLDSAYQYFYNYIEERKKDEKTIHIYEREFY